MTAVLEFELCRPVDGYRVLSIDQRKLAGVTVVREGNKRFFVLPRDVTNDERRFLNRWGLLRVLSVSGKRARIIHVLEPQSSKMERCDLFESAPGLFFELAHTPMTLEGVKAFADRSGLLSPGFFPEQVDHWYSPIREMRRAVVAWQEAKATGDFKKVIRIIKRRGEPHLFARDQEFVGIVANVLLKKDLLSGVARLCIRPTDLLDALWIQLTLAIDGNQNLRSCAECRTWFPIEAGGSRSDKEYCSDACRMRAYRKRKKGAH